MNKFNIKRRNKKEVIVDTKFEEVVDNKNLRTKKENNNSFGGLVILTILLSLISGFLGAYLVIMNGADNISNDGGIITSTAKLEEVNSISGAVKNIYDAVVVVEVYKDKNLVSTGTGFVYKKEDKKTYLMTNNHVLSEEGDIKVLFTSGDEVSAEVVGSDVYSDIAVLSINSEKDIKAAVLGKSEDSKIGDTVFAVGSPEGSDYAGTVTKGIVSGKNRIVEVALANTNTVDYYMEVLQTDAAINPGNSGGPICNINGEVIGITNMKLVDDTVEGMGFAIPIEDAVEVAKILEEKGKVVRPYVGIEMLDLSNQFNLWKAGILIPGDIENGVVVYNVVDNSPADKAELKKGDIIIKLNDKDIKNLADFRYELYKYSPDDEIEIVYIRDESEEKTKIVLGDGE